MLPNKNGHTSKRKMIERPSVMCRGRHSTLDLADRHKINRLKIIARHQPFHLFLRKIRNIAKVYDMAARIGMHAGMLMEKNKLFAVKHNAAFFKEFANCSFFRSLAFVDNFAVKLVVSLKEAARSALKARKSFYPLRTSTDYQHSIIETQ